ncbi:MAG: right-handed parallel beta-helix repeat-containing protein [Planctomycetota bacterium]|nr:right-handed parallel beta-helix repeat-containing protein [Planctomycetota bacterium]
MHPRFLVQLATTLVMAAVLAACGGSGGGSLPPGPQAVEYWVDAQAGSDQAPGTQAQPFKTLTHAIKAAGPGTTIHALPGLYDSANGEVFPLELQEGQQLLGDIANRGLGQVPTTIAGEGATPHNVEGTLLMADSSRLAGFEIGGDQNPSFHHAVHVRHVSAEVEHNTFAGPTYGGVYAEFSGGSTIAHNDFHTYAYGAYLTGLPGGVTIASNTFTSSLLPIHMQAATLEVVVTDNYIVGSGQVGILVWSGTALITGNTFNNPAGYTYGAIRTATPSSTPVIRFNTFICTLAVLITDGQPDLGTAMDPGGNVLSAVTGAAIQHEGSSAVSAIGNTWQNTPPTNGGDIVITGTGTVTWGTAPGEQY